MTSSDVPLSPEPGGPSARPPVNRPAGAPVAVTADEAVMSLTVPGETEVAGALLVVSPPRRPIEPASLAAASHRLATLPCVLVAAPGWDPPTPVRDLVDVVVDTDDELEAVVAGVEAQHVPAMSAVVHLRSSPRRDVLDGLVAESTLFSALQAGGDHRRWRASTPLRQRGNADDGRRVQMERRGDELVITLVRPQARNALDAAMRDQLLEALAVVEADPSLRAVVCGEGPSFCSGGDLNEFGTAPPPPEAHLIRIRRSIGAVLHRLAARTMVLVHGPCAGSGVELPAFAGRVVSRTDATFVLPELAMGLIPGAGGTVSLPARIGRHRTAWLVLSGRGIDAGTALRWGLVDEIVPR